MQAGHSYDRVSDLTLRQRNPKSFLFIECEEGSQWLTK